MSLGLTGFRLHRLTFASVLGAVGLAACSSSSNLPQGFEAYSTLDSAGMENPDASYLLGAGDRISLMVFGQPEMSVPEVIVPPDGAVNVPLVGPVHANGMTAQQFAGRVEDAFRPAYLRNPQVTVNVVDYGSKQVTVDGQINRPGVLNIMGQARLSEVIARAGGPSQLAQLNEVIVIRRGGQERTAAQFDLRAIRSGAMDDPMIFGDDLVVVGFDELEGLYRDALTALPLVAIFSRF